MYLRPWISKHAWAKFNLGQLVKVQAEELRTPNQWGKSLTYKQWYALTATHPLFSPPTSAPNPCFYQKLSPKVLFFSHCPEFWKFFSQRPLIGWNLRKRYPNVPYFYGFCDWKTPYFFALHTHGLFEGNVAPSNTVGSWKILYSRNIIVQFGEYFQVQI